MPNKINGCKKIFEIGDEIIVAGNIVWCKECFEKARKVYFGWYVFDIVDQWELDHNPNIKCGDKCEFYYVSKI